MNRITALIIGAGKIGAFFDDPKSKDIITHAHAYKKHPNFKLLGFVDNDPSKASLAAKVWGVKSYKNIEEAFSKENQIDVVSVCVPDDFHYEILKDVANRPVKVIFAEKPITKSLAEAKEIIALCKEKNISLQVNYSRRFVPEYIELRKEITRGDFGKFITGSGYYGKGIIHNGSHLIDLIRTFTSEIVGIKSISKNNDFYEDDPSVSAILSMKNGGSIVFMTMDCHNYTVFELDLLFEKGRIRIKNSGEIIEKYEAKKSDSLKDYKFLYKTCEIKTSSNRSIYFAIENIFSNIKSNAQLLCTGIEAYQNLSVAIDLKDKQ